MKKIVELIIKMDDLELNGVGVDAMALVENPAIELDFLAFAEEKFVEPTASETEEEFIGRCIPVVIGEGYEQDQAIAICYSYWQSKDFGVDPGNLTPYVDQTGPLKKKEQLSDEQQTIVDYFASCGEEYDPEEAIFVKIKDNTFSDFTDFLKGVAALDILGKNLKQEDPGETVYRYAGPRAERGFCRAMLSLNRVYRPNEITGLNTANPGFGPHDNPSTYSVLKYKGGSNCRHYWEALTMFKRDGRHVFISRGPVTAMTEGGPGMSGVDLDTAGKSCNERSPSATGYVPNNARLKNVFSFSADDEQRIVTGPAMIPNKMILRKDENGNPYYVYFTQQTIKDIAEKVFEENKQNMTNIEHNAGQTHTQNTLLESWIVQDPEMDKSKALGFNVPQGTWMVSYKINDDQTWKMVKEGKLRGFSVEGYFIEKAEAAKAQAAMEQMYRDILNVLKDVE